MPSQNQCWYIHGQDFQEPSGACMSTGGNDPRAPCLSSWTLGKPAKYVLECDPALPHPAVEWLVSLIFCSGTLEHAAHPSTVFSFLWPLGCTFLPSEQAEQRPLCAPVSNTHTAAHWPCSLTLSSSAQGAWPLARLNQLVPGWWWEKPRTNQKWMKARGQVQGHTEPWPWCFWSKLTKPEIDVLLYPGTVFDLPLGNCMRSTNLDK